MTTVVEALNRIARQCSIKAPSSWVSATRDDHVSLRDDFLNETVEDILERVGFTVANWCANDNYRDGCGNVQLARKLCTPASQ